ncbi:radical SAM protein [Anoxybacterium hadale]|uniref:Radical SAM protein n=1 Tax=Anoxybacterium hadale TaxID=3408580 RepID=A0ACD1AA12_9FIRM|nr:radical SAM protein [Clostridiales bacterium]
MTREKGHRSIPYADAVLPILRGRIPGQLIIQYTDVCNALCPQCSMRKTEAYERSKLSRDEVCRIIDAAAEQKIQALSFTGGEPFLFLDELIELIQYASFKKIPFIRTGTNGYLFSNWRRQEYVYEIHNLAEKLARTNLRNLWISIDSADPRTHEQMRGLPGVIRGIEIALPIFHEYGIYPAANLGINRNIGGMGLISEKMIKPDEFYREFKEAFERFYGFIIDMGFTMANVCYPMSIAEEHSASDDAAVNGGDTGGGLVSGVASAVNLVYGAASASNLVSFTDAEKVQIFRALMDTIPKFREEIRIFTPLVSLYSLIRQYSGYSDDSLPCRGGIDFFYVDAKEGNTYPCGYRGKENLGKFYNLDIKNLKEKRACRDCDWECFRDPSEQVGYLIEAVRNPVKLIRYKTSEYRRLWNQDLLYFHRCSYFDGRKAR